MYVTETLSNLSFLSGPQGVRSQMVAWSVNPGAYIAADLAILLEQPFVMLEEV